MVTDVLEDPQQETLISQQIEKGSSKYTAILVVPSESSDGKKGPSRQWTPKGSCSRGAKMCIQARPAQRQRKRIQATANTKSDKPSTTISRTRIQHQDRNKLFRTRRSTILLHLKEGELLERQKLRLLAPSFVRFPQKMSMQCRCK